LKVIAKKVGSKLKSRVIPEQSIVKWSQIIDEMEDQYSAVISAERDERALRKAEMEFAKVGSFGSCLCSIIVGIISNS
jgi:ATP-dependent RNA helicase DDX27